MASPAARRPERRGRPCGRRAQRRLGRRRRDPHPRSGADQPGAAVPDHIERAERSHPHQSEADRRGRPRRELDGLGRRQGVHFQSARGRDLPRRQPVYRRRRPLHLQPLQGSGEVDPFARPRQRQGRDQGRRPYGQDRARGAAGLVPDQDARALERARHDHREPARPREAGRGAIRPDPGRHRAVPGHRPHPRPIRRAREVRQVL